MADVFISYKREDIARVEPLVALLLDLDVSVWFDAGIEVGVEWEQRIQEEIDATWRARAPQNGRRTFEGALRPLTPWPPIGASAAPPKR